jgi:hypothetical protein
MTYNIDQLYGSIGKSGNTIDAEGRDYWTQALNSGQKTVQDFYDSAKSVYGNASSYGSNPYATNNVTGLYGLAGKTPGLIDQQGMDYWKGALGDGSKTAQDFGNSAKSVYQDTLNGVASPFESQNRQGLTNLANGFTNGTGYGQNPYLGGIADDITRRSQDALGQGLNQIRGGAIAAGGLGGGRQGVAEGIAVSRSNDNLTGQLAGLYGTDWNNSQNRDLTRYGMDQNYDRGLGNLQLGNQGQMLNFYNQGRQLDQSGVALGANLYDRGTQGQWSPIENANSILTPYAGNGTTTINSGGGGNNWQQIAAGLGGGAQFGKSMGWWG